MGWVSMIKPTNQAHKIKRNACLKKLSANNFLYYFSKKKTFYTTLFAFIWYSLLFWLCSFVSNIAIDKITVHG